MPAEKVRLQARASALSGPARELLNVRADEPPRVCQSDVPPVTAARLGAGEHVTVGETIGDWECVTLAVDEREGDKVAELHRDGDVVPHAEAVVVALGQADSVLLPVAHFETVAQDEALVVTVTETVSEGEVLVVGVGVESRHATAWGRYV